MLPSAPARNAGYRSQLKPVDNLHALPDALRISPQNAHALFEYQRQELVRRTKPLFSVMKLRLAGVQCLDQGFVCVALVISILTIK